MATDIALSATELDLSEFEEGFDEPCLILHFGFLCGTPAKWKADATCDGCGTEVRHVYLCAKHKDLAEAGMVAFHANPCGYKGLRLSLVNVESIG